MTRTLAFLTLLLATGCGGGGASADPLCVTTFDEEESYLDQQCSSAVRNNFLAACDSVLEGTTGACKTCLVTWMELDVTAGECVADIGSGCFDVCP